MKINNKLIVKFILCIALALSSCSLSNGHIRLFSDLHRSVSHEYRELAKEIYKQYCSEITEIWIAEDNRSHECIRFAFFSESALSKDVVENILDRVHETIQESRNKPDIGSKYFLSIEVATSPRVDIFTKVLVIIPFKSTPSILATSTGLGK